MRLQYLLVGDTRVKLRGTKGKEGQGKAGTAVALTVLFGPIGLIKTRQERGYQKRGLRCRRTPTKLRIAGKHV
jgi:hypothetical protein